MGQMTDASPVPPHVPNPHTPSPQNSPVPNCKTMPAQLLWPDLKFKIRRLSRLTSSGVAFDPHVPSPHTRSGCPQVIMLNGLAAARMSTQNVDHFCSHA